jgi:hypothetical protein
MRSRLITIIIIIAITTTIIIIIITTTTSRRCDFNPHGRADGFGAAVATSL